MLIFYILQSLLYDIQFKNFCDWKSLSWQAQKKAATEEAEKQKKEEIKVLQDQLAALKEIQAEVQAGKVRVFWVWFWCVFPILFCSSGILDSLQWDNSNVSFKRGEGMQKEEGLHDMHSETDFYPEQSSLILGFVFPNVV